MPDPHVLYIVTAVVVAGLVAWVIAVLSRPANHEPLPPEEKAPPAGAPGTGPSGPVTPS
ncbi:MAG TPA: hypothetical protein VN894_16945 [Polyangiaceae bacterium]|nr:hypothetical protein [Polyangiaceae bacterium]